MDREKLEERKAALLADNYVIAGHLREVDYWLAQLDQEEAPSPPPDEPPVLYPAALRELPDPTKRTP